jgi:hypothetical protein
MHGWLYFVQDVTVRQGLDRPARSRRRHSWSRSSAKEMQFRIVNYTQLDGYEIKEIELIVC